MRPAKRILQTGLLLSLAFLTACGGQKEPEPTPIDPIAIFTQAAQTVAAQMTQTAQAAAPTPMPPTATPVPPTATLASLATVAPFNTPALTPGVFTPLPSPTLFNNPPPTQSGPLCDDAIYVADITIPDGTKLKPGEDFQKIWRIQNTGTCTWDDGYSLVFAFGDPLDGPPWKITKTKDFVAPGETKDIGIWMTAHLAPGEYSGCWRMKNDRDVLFGGIVCVDIVVAE